MRNALIMDSILGKIVLEEEDGFLVRIHLSKMISNQAVLTESLVLLEAKRQLEEYFNQKRTDFNLPLKISGTNFQRKVYEALQEIPYGKLVSYQYLAEKIGHPKAFRAVGMANHCNPLAIVIPCHRVVGKNGSLTGYAGGIEKKQQLIELEKSSQVGK